MQTFLVTDPAGRDHVRTSQNRTYTHAIATRPDYQACLEFAASPEWDKTLRRNYAYEIECAGLDPMAEPEGGRRKAAETRKANGQKIAAEFPTAQDYIDHARAERIAAVERRKAEGHFQKWNIEGWAGRPDLAAKALAKARNLPRVAEAVALVATATPGRHPAPKSGRA